MKDKITILGLKNTKEYQKYSFKKDKGFINVFSKILYDLGFKDSEFDLVLDEHYCYDDKMYNKDDSIKSKYLIDICMEIENNKCEVTTFFGSKRIISIFRYKKITGKELSKIIDKYSAWYRPK